MKTIRFTLPFLLLPCLLQAQSTQPQTQSSTPDLIDLHRGGECTAVHPGSKIRFSFRMSFDRPVPSTSPEAAVGFSGSSGRQLGVHELAVKKLDEPDVWEFTGVVLAGSNDGEYQMSGLWARYPLGSNPTSGQVFAWASLTPEARQELANYKVCVTDGSAPVPAGKITEVGQPRK